MPAGDFGRIFANSYRKSFLLCAAHDYSSHVAACRINNLQLELAKIRRIVGENGLSHDVAQTLVSAAPRLFSALRDVQNS
jgi:hypothetical protein